MTEPVDPAAELLDLVAQLRRLLVLLAGDCLFLVAGELLGLPLQIAKVDARCLHPQPHPRAGLIDEVDGLVRQEPVGDIAVGQLDGGNQRLVGVADLMVRLVAVAQPAQDGERVVDGRLGHQDRLEPPGQRGVLLDVLAVLVQRGGTRHVQLAARQRRLDHVAGVHAALGPSAGAD